MRIKPAHLRTLLLVAAAVLFLFACLIYGDGAIISGVSPAALEAGGLFVLALSFLVP